MIPVSTIQSLRAFSFGRPTNRALRVRGCCRQKNTYMQNGGHKERAAKKIVTWMQRFYLLHHTCDTSKIHNNHAVGHWRRWNRRSVRTGVSATFEFSDKLFARTSVCGRFHYLLPLAEPPLGNQRLKQVSFFYPWKMAGAGRLAAQRWLTLPRYGALQRFGRKNVRNHLYRNLDLVNVSFSGEPAKPSPSWSSL